MYPIFIFSYRKFWDKFKMAQKQTRQQCMSWSQRSPGELHEHSSFVQHIAASRTFASARSSIQCIARSSAYVVISGSRGENNRPFPRKTQPTPARPVIDDRRRYASSSTATHTKKPIADIWWWRWMRPREEDRKSHGRQNIFKLHS